MKRNHTISTVDTSSLTDREEIVLKMIVRHFVLTANPVGSGYLSKQFEGHTISPATIRNVMSDLEEKGFITHPHTSAGRIPTDLGYRFYVDTMTNPEHLSNYERATIKKNLKSQVPPQQFMREASRLLGAISRQLAIVTAPELLDAELLRLDLVRLSSTRLLIVLSLKAGLIRTITLELDNDELPDNAAIDDVTSRLNERLSGKTLRWIRQERFELFNPLNEQLPNNDSVIRLFLDSADEIFSNPREFDRLHISPTQNILDQPEFASPEQIRGIVELVENEEVIIHLMEGHDISNGQVEILIGSENRDSRMMDYSLIVTKYMLGGQYAGTVGLIGPKRMDYARMIAAVEYISKTITFQNPNP